MWRRIALGIAIASAFGAGLSLAATSRESAPSTLGPSYGLSLELPKGWIGRIYDANRGTQPPIADLQAGSFLTADDLDLLKDSDLGSGVAQDMQPADILILVWETLGSGGFDYEPLLSAPQIGPDNLMTALEGMPTGHAVGRVFFSTEGRAFDLMVEFGTLSPEPAQLDRANQVLRTLRVGPRTSDN